MDVLKPLLDFYYVQPARLRRKRYAVEERIAPPARVEEAGELEEAESSADAWTVVKQEAAEEAAAKQPIKEPVKEPIQ